MRQGYNVDVEERLRCDARSLFLGCGVFQDEGEWWTARNAIRADKKNKAAENEKQIADKREGRMKKKAVHEEKKKKKILKGGVLMKEDGIREMDEEEV